jgi:hypothetical protein
VPVLEVKLKMKYYSIVILFILTMFCCVNKYRKTNELDKSQYFETIIKNIVNNEKIPDDQFIATNLSKECYNKTGIDSIRPILRCYKIGNSIHNKSNEFSYIFNFEGEKGKRILSITIINNGNTWKIINIERIISFYAKESENSKNQKQ